MLSWRRIVCRIRVHVKGEREGGRLQLRRRPAGAGDRQGRQRQRRRAVPGGVGVAAVPGRPSVRRRRRCRGPGRHGLPAGRRVRVHARRDLHRGGTPGAAVHEGCPAPTRTVLPGARRGGDLQSGVAGC
jgi:hypothetical protein